VGINLLQKIVLPTLPTLYGALLAGAATSCGGRHSARSPASSTGCTRQAASLLGVRGALPGEEFTTQFDPRAFLGGDRPSSAPAVPAIVSSSTLASALGARRAAVWTAPWGPTAGSHNARRAARHPSARRRTRVGRVDVVDLREMAALGAPFWLAGSYGRVGGLAEARAEGAAGIQVGTAFAYCNESGLDAELKRRVLASSATGDAHVFTDPVASPTGFPIKVVQLEGTMSNADVYAHRDRICDLGYLRHAYRQDGGTVGWRCPAEPVADYVAKGGDEAETVGRKCICNGLMATIGQPQVRGDGSVELPFVTSGDRVAGVADFLPPGATSYTARDVLDQLLAGVLTDVMPARAGA
jgi:nitronate monooxygenase